MPAKRFNEADIDFDAMDGELAKLVPPKLSLADVLDRLRKRLVEQQAKGVTVAQMHEVLNAGGIAITERSLRTFLDQGRVAGKEGCRGRQGHGVGRRQRSVLTGMKAHMDPRSGDTTFGERRSVVAVFGMRIMKLQWGMAGRQRGASAPAYGDGAKRRAVRRRCIVRRTRSRQRA